MDFFKNKVFHQSNLDYVESDLSVRLDELRAKNPDSENAKILEAHIKKISEARAFLSEVCEETIRLMQERFGNDSQVSEKGD